MATEHRTRKKPHHRFKRGEFEPVNPAHRGMTTRAAHRAGESVTEYAREHAHDPGAAGKRARFVLIAKKWRHGRRKKRSGHRGHRSHHTRY